MNRIFERFIACFLCACAMLWAAAAQADIGNIKVVVFGDSLTSGYELSTDQAFAAKLARKFKQTGFYNVDVINMSVAAETTAGGLERLSKLLALRPDIVILELGSNDVLRGINPKLIESNLRQILDKLTKSSIYVIFAGTRAPANMGNAYTSQIDSLYRILGEAYTKSASGWAFYPFILEGIVNRPELNLGDGIHPNNYGVDVMVSNIYPLVDAAVRWKWQVITQEQYQQQMQQQQQMLPDSVPAER